ncbi:MAG: hypothetical protein ACYDBT_06855 [Desulfobulbaceae bacterium]
MKLSGKRGNTIHFRQKGTELGRRLILAEYEEVLEELDRLVMEYGWVQGLESPGRYCPDFARSHPFAK